MTTSLAKIFIEDETIEGKSLMYKMESSGPKMKPSVTSENTAAWL